VDYLQDILRAPREKIDKVVGLMPTQKTSLRLTVFKVEKTKWKAVASRHRLRLSEFVRWTVNTKVRIPTLDLAKKLEKKKPEQMCIIDVTNYDAQCSMF